VSADGGLIEAWAIVRGQPVFYRHREPSPDAHVIVHVHGFAGSGRYMLPTAAMLSDTYRTYVPDLPGFGQSVDPDHTLSIPELADSAAAFLDVLGIETASMVGSSLGCSIVAAFAHRHPHRLDSAILVSPAGGENNQPLLRAVSQILHDAPREPLSVARVAVPDYVRFGIVPAYRLFSAMTKFPAAERLLELDVPTLIALGSRDPLLPGPDRIRQMANDMHAEARVVVIRGAAHAVNHSHPRELSALIDQFLTDRPLVGAAGPMAAAPVAELKTRRPADLATQLTA